MRNLLIFSLCIISLFAYSQNKDSYEKYPFLKYEKAQKWKIYENENKVDLTLSIPKFFND